MPDTPSIQILVTLDFQGQLRKLAKRYRSIRSDLQPLFDETTLAASEIREIVERFNEATETPNPEI